MDAPQFKFISLSEAHLPLLHQWLQRPHLRKWWSREKLSLEGVRQQYLSDMSSGGSRRSFLGYVGTRPIGYLQYCPAGENPGWWPDQPGRGVVSIDQFLAHGDQLDQGWGTAMISQCIQFLLEDPGVVEIRVDPRPDNRRAIRCYQKVGFQEMGPITTPDGPALLMILKRSTIEGP